MVLEPKKPEPKTPVVTPLANPQGNHKNAVVGPATGKQLPEWRKSRDYEQFNPTAEK